MACEMVWKILYTNVLSQLNKKKDIENGTTTAKKSKFNAKEIIYKNYKSIPCICTNKAVDPITKEKIFELQDFAGNKKVIGRHDLVNAMALGTLHVANLQLANDMRIMDKKCITVNSIEDVNEHLKNGEQNCAIGNTNIGYFIMYTQYNLIDYVGINKTVYLPEIRSIEDTAFAFEDYAEELIIPGTCTIMTTAITFGNNIKNIKLLHSYEEFKSLFIQAYTDDVLYRKYKSMQHNEEVTIEINNKKVSYEELKKIFENITSMKVINFFGARDIVDKKIDDYYKKSMILGYQDHFLIDYSTSALREYKAFHRLIMTHDKVNELTLPPVMTLKNRWAYNFLTNDNFETVIGTLYIPSTVDIQKLKTEYIPFVELRKTDKKDVSYRLKAILIDELNLNDNNSIEILDDELGELTVTFKGKRDKAKNIEITNSKKGMPLKIIEVLEYYAVYGARRVVMVADTNRIKAGKPELVEHRLKRKNDTYIYIIEDKDGNRKKVYKYQLIEAFLEDKIYFVNATVFLDSTIKFSK